MNYYVYTHVFPNGVRYVGKGKGYRATHTKNRNRFWQNLYNKYGLPVITITLNNLTQTDAFRYEKQFISNYKITNIPLCNLTPGGEGEGHPHTNEHKALLRRDNPNKKVICIYDNYDKLQLVYNGTLTSSKDDIPKNAFIKSYKNKGLPLGYSKQSRTELRKRMHQQYIGWYALLQGSIKTSTVIVDTDIEKAQKLGLTSKLTFGEKGQFNPNAKCFEFKNEKGEVVGTSFGNFHAVRKQLGIPSGLAAKALYTKAPIKTNRKKSLHLNGWTITKKE